MPNKKDKIQVSSDGEERRRDEIRISHHARHSTPWTENENAPPPHHLDQGSMRTQGSPSRREMKSTHDFYPNQRSDPRVSPDTQTTFSITITIISHRVRWTFISWPWPTINPLALSCERLTCGHPQKKWSSRVEQHLACFSSKDYFKRMNKKNLAMRFYDMLEPRGIINKIFLIHIVC
jgi:hypothetical protein